MAVENNNVPQKKKTYTRGQLISRFFNYQAPTDTGGCGGKEEAKPEMKVEEYCKIVIDKVDDLNLKERALHALNLDEEQVKEVEPIVIESFQFNKIGNGELLYKKGCTNLYQVTTILFGDEELYVHSYKFDMLSTSFSESTREYFYQDVVSIQTWTQEEELENTYTATESSGCGKTQEVTRKYKTMKETSQFKIISSGDDFYCYIKNNPETKEQIKALLSKIRDKKVQQGSVVNNDF